MYRLAMVLMLMLPAACAAPGPPGPVPGKTAVAVVTPRQEQTVTPAPAPAPPQIDLKPPKNAGLPTGAALQPDQLIGLPDHELAQILGTPDFRRNDPPAQLWQYRSSSCRFDVFLFQDTARAAAYTVTHIEARGLDVYRVSDRDCFLSVLKNRRPG